MPSMPVGFWSDKDKAEYIESYFSQFKNIWSQGDYAQITSNNGLIIYGRSDATLNPGGIRIGTAEIYRIVEEINEIEESLVVGQNWQNDIRIVLFIKLANEQTFSENLKLLISSSISSICISASKP